MYPRYVSRSLVCAVHLAHLRPREACKVLRDKPSPTIPSSHCTASSLYFSASPLPFTSPHLTASYRISPSLNFSASYRIPPPFTSPHRTASYRIRSSAASRKTQVRYCAHISSSLKYILELVFLRFCWSRQLFAASVLIRSQVAILQYTSCSLILRFVICNLLLFLFR